ncbi:MAG TPA: hypothetical protein VGM84_07880 [Steroidobacteraceae bacterium]|jgi:hypothetical protein
MEPLQAILVAAIVIASAGYSLWRLTSVRFHLRMVDALGRVMGNSPESWVGKLRAKTLSQIATGGGACGSCAPNTKAAVHGTTAKPAPRN